MWEYGASNQQIYFFSFKRFEQRRLDDFWAFSPLIYDLIEFNIIFQKPP